MDSQRSTYPALPAGFTRGAALFLAAGALWAFDSSQASTARQPAGSHSAVVPRKAPTPGNAIYLAARSSYTETRGRSARADSVAAGVQRRFTLPTSSYSAGILVEYSFAHVAGGELILAGMFGYKRSAWMVSASPFLKKASDSGAEWRYAAGIRRRLARRHWLGVELLGPLGGHRPSKRMIGYYGAISDTVSVNVAVGKGGGKGLDRATRAAVVWRFR
jgi:hypothetical protein